MDLNGKNSSPIPNFGGTPGENSFLSSNKILIGLILLLVIAIGIVAFVIILRKPIRKGVPAVVEVSCHGTAYNVFRYTFKNKDSCLKNICPDKNPAYSSPDPNNDRRCVEGNHPAPGNVCQDFSEPIGNCETVQMDCVSGGPSCKSTATIRKICDCVNVVSPTVTLTPTTLVSPTNTPTPTPTATPGPTATNTPAPSVTPIASACASKACDNTTNPCANGLICVQATDGSNYCTFPEFQTACKQNPSQASCCTSPGLSPTPTEIILVRTTATPGPSSTPAPKTTAIPAAGVATYGQVFGIVSLGIVLLGLIL